MLYNDLEEILSLQKLAYQSEAKLFNDYTIPPLTQTIEEIRNDYKKQLFLKALLEEKIVGSVRAYKKEGVCYIGRLFVHPKHQNRGIGKKLMVHIEDCFSEVDKYSLFTGKKSKKNIYFYESLGYNQVKEEQLNNKVRLIYFEKSTNWMVEV